MWRLCLSWCIWLGWGPWKYWGVPILWYKGVCTGPSHIIPGYLSYCTIGSLELSTAQMGPWPHQGRPLYFKELWLYCLLLPSTTIALVQALTTSYGSGSPHYNPSSAVQPVSFLKCRHLTSLVGSKHFMMPCRIKSKLLTVVQRPFVP